MAHRRLKELGWPVSADLAAWLDGMVHKEEERRRAMSAQQAANPSAGSSMAASSEPGSRDSPTGEDANAAPTPQPEPKPSQAQSPGAVAATAAAAVQLPPDKQRAATEGVDASSAAGPSGGLPASVLARLPRLQGRQGLQGPVRLPEGLREQLRSASLESEALSGRFSSFGSDALLDRYSSMSSVDSQTDLPAQASQVTAVFLSAALGFVNRLENDSRLPMAFCMLMSRSCNVYLRNAVCM